MNYRILNGALFGLLRRSKSSKYNADFSYIFPFSIKPVTVRKPRLLQSSPSISNLLLLEMSM